jgi:hypothetical protein
VLSSVPFVLVLSTFHPLSSAAEQQAKVFHIGFLRNSEALEHLAAATSGGIAAPALSQLT